MGMLTRNVSVSMWSRNKNDIARISNLPLSIEFCFDFEILFTGTKRRRTSYLEKTTINILGVAI